MVSVSVLIPTYNRADLLKFTLDGLCEQSCNDFEVIFIVKPSGDGTEQLIDSYREKLNLKLVIQNRGFVTDALNLGFENKTGYITAFLDDDAIIGKNWVSQIIKYYRDKTVGGVAGNVIPVNIRNGHVVVAGKSEVLPKKRKTFLSRKLWCRPVDGLEQYMLYLTKAGVLRYNADVFNETVDVPSFLGMGANMSVLSEAIRGFRFPSGGWVRGLLLEQYLAFFIWKKGYKLLFSPHPDLKVFHIKHAKSLSRPVSSSNVETLRCLERNLLYYRLRSFHHFSRMYRNLWILTQIIRYCMSGSLRDVSLLRGVIFSEILGIKWILTNRFGGDYKPLADLMRWSERSI